MKQNKLLIIILAIVALYVSAGCEFKSEKSKIASAMREYVEPRLSEGETFHFVGLSNRRDTVFMGVAHPCSGVIYTVTDRKSGEKTRHFADVIFSNDYKTALSVEELDFDPIKSVEEKITEKLKEKLHGK